MSDAVELAILGGGLAGQCLARHLRRAGVDVPIIGIGGIANIDDVMQFLVTGASAVQIGTANYYDPTVSVRLIDQLSAALAEIGETRVKDVVGTLKV